MKVQAIVFSSLALAGIAWAQAGPGRSGPRGLSEFRLHHGKLVQGAPYSAVVNSTSVKTLADGNSIQHSTSSQVARDSQGRTYSRETITGLWGQPETKTFTFISDPVAGFVYTLNAETKTATRRAFHARTDTSSAASSRPANPEVVSADLGTQTMNGVNVTGKKATHTIPAGKMGNSQPIVITTETWFSPDLQVVVAQKRSSPTDGVASYSLNNIQRAEPAAALFQVPADYTIKDAPSFQHGNFDRQP